MVGSDGASVNGCHNGVKEQLQTLFTWHFGAWCFSHQLELACEDFSKGSRSECKRTSGNYSSANTMTVGSCSSEHWELDSSEHWELDRESMSRGPTCFSFSVRACSNRGSPSNGEDPKLPGIIQNEIIEVAANCIRSIYRDGLRRCPHFSVMADEVSSHGKEILSICLHYLDIDHGNFSFVRISNEHT